MCPEDKLDNQPWWCMALGFSSTGDSQLNTSAAEGEGPSTSSSASSQANQEPQQKEPEQEVDAEQEQDNTSSTPNVAASTETSPPPPQTQPPRADSPLFDTEGDSPAPKLTNGIEDDSDWQHP